MSKNSLKIQLSGVDELLSTINKMGGNVNEAAEKAISASAESFYQDLKTGIKKHKRSGLTEASLKSPSNVTWEGNRCSLQVGFNIKEGGLPALFLEYGTPTIKARPIIQPAINKANRQSKKIQREALEKLIERLKQ